MIARSIVTSLLALVIIMDLLTSCNGSPKHPAELASADSLCRVLKTMDSTYKHTDTLLLRKTLRSITYNLAYIQLNGKDTLSKEEGLRLMRYNSLKRPLRIYLQTNRLVAENIDKEKKQCENLAHDLKHNTLDSKLSASSCLMTEMRRVASLSNTVGSIYPTLKRTLLQTASFDSVIVKEVDMLKAKGGKEPADIDKLSQSMPDND